MSGVCRREAVVPASEYRTLVVKAHRRFHLDKWKSWGLLRTVLDEELRAQLKCTGNMVGEVEVMMYITRRNSGTVCASSNLA